ncbi:DUF58 domain-containing protein [Hahella sp. SMD15-11]|uniref:DUF58 domain-containing protein n=1 Tax=Thermohahella caldifontis TaxID=3142973 RepID=A0AB39UZA5_9GAMM
MLKANVRERIGRWIDARSPEAPAFTLTQRTVYVLPTRWGMGFLMLVVLLFLSGVNYQNSMMLAMAFLSLAVFMTHIVWTYRNLSGLHVAFRQAESGHAGETGLVMLRVAAAGHPHVGVELGWPGVGWQKVHLAAGETRDVSLRCRLGRRGPFNPGRMLITTTAPFGLIRAWSWQRLRVPLWVWPKPVEGPFPGARNEMDDGTAQARRTAAGDELSDLRDWEPGEPVTRISWRHVAAHDQWLVKTLDTASQSEVWLDMQAIRGDTEYRLSVLAGWVETCSRASRRFGLILGRERLAPGQGEGHRRKALDALARWGFSDATRV